MIDREYNKYLLKNNHVVQEILAKGKGCTNGFVGPGAEEIKFKR